MRRSSAALSGAIPTLFSIPTLFVLALGVVGCQAEGGQADIADITGVNRGPAYTPAPIPSGEEQVMVGDTCHSSDPSKYCLALKYVVYKDASGNPMASTSDAVNNIKHINTVWSQCGIQFQIDEYAAVGPAEFKLAYATSTYPELDDIRNTFDGATTLLIVTTGPWNRAGTLGNTSANAWTAMPGSGPYGAVLEKSVATYPNIIAHEIGHYLNLDHANDKSNLMNPVIYTYSTTLSSGQCQAARNAASSYWQKMQR